MTENNQLTIIRNDSLAVMPVMDMGLAASRRQAVIDFTRTLMVTGTHYGTIPGTKKDTLYKAGAEMLINFFGLQPRFKTVSKVEDWTGADHDGEPFFYYHFACELWRGDMMIGQADGSCNSWESRYRYRNASKTCPQCGGEAIIKGKAEYGGGWLCFAKKGGCGAKFNDGDPQIENQPTGKVKNENGADVANTVLKMAQKRALVAVTLIAVNASEFFTQDVEDIKINGAAPQKVSYRQPQPPPPVREEIIEGVVEETPDPPKKPTSAMMKKFHAAGVEKYGDEWDTKRPLLVGSVTKQRSTSSKHLTREECQKLIDGITGEPEL